MNISLMWPHLMLVAGIFPKFSSVFAQLGHADEAQYLANFDAMQASTYAVADEDLPLEMNVCKNNQGPPSHEVTVQASNGLLNSSEVSDQCGDDSVCVIPLGTTLQVTGNLNLGALIVRGIVEWSDSTQLYPSAFVCAGYAVVEGLGKWDMTLQEKDAYIYLKDNGAVHPTLRSRAFGSATTTDSDYPVVEIAGRELNRTWSLLSNPIQAGDDTMTLMHNANLMGWRVGDRIGIAPTEKEARGWGEEFTIIAIDAQGSLQLDQQAKYDHMASFTPKVPHGNTPALMSAEVVNLSRNIVITGDDFKHVPCDPNLPEAVAGEQTSVLGCRCSSFRNQCTIGLHTAIMSGGAAKIQNTRIERCGQRGVEGKYCLHFHKLHDCPTCVFKNNAIEGSHQRGVIIHGTHSSTVEGNVLYNVRGAGIYVEDGNEMYNDIKYNTVICPFPYADGSLHGCTIPGTSNSIADTADNQCGIFSRAQTNSLIGNRVANSFNGMFLKAGSIGRGESYNKVCESAAKIARYEGNTFHGNGRFGTYALGFNYPKQIDQSILTDGHNIDKTLCSGFDNDGFERGFSASIVDNVDYHNAFVGHYSAGDLQYHGHISHNNVNNLYWKETKNFNNGCSAHITGASYANGNLGLPDQGTFLIENSVFGNGAQLEANHHCGVGETGVLCFPQYIFDNVMWRNTDMSQKWIWFQHQNFQSHNNNQNHGGVFSLSPPDAERVMNGEHIQHSIFPPGFVSLVSSKYTYLLQLPGQPCVTSDSLGSQYGLIYDFGILCKVPLRALKVYTQGVAAGTAPGLLLEVWYNKGGVDNQEVGVPDTSQVIPFHQTGWGEKRGYSFPVIPSTDHSYRLSLSGEDLPALWVIEFSDFVVGNRFGVEYINLSLNGQRCGQNGLVSSHHDRRFMWSGDAFMDPQAWGKTGACASPMPPDFPLIDCSLINDGVMPADECPDLCGGSCDEERSYCDCGSATCKLKPGFTDSSDLCGAARCQNGSCSTTYLGSELPVTSNACICNEGWSGTLCQFNPCEASGKTCSGRGICVAVSDSEAKCVCDDGFSGEDCEHTCDGFCVGEFPYNCGTDIAGTVKYGCHQDGGCHYLSEGESYPYGGFCTYKQVGAQECTCNRNNDCEMNSSCNADGSCPPAQQFADLTPCNSVPLGVCKSGICVSGNDAPHDEPTTKPSWSPTTTPTTSLANPTSSPSNLAAPTYYCGCDSCTQAVWDTLATDGGGSYSCGGRITWLIDTQSYSEDGACSKVESEFPDLCPCNPWTCSGSTPTNPPTKLPTLPPTEIPTPLPTPLPSNAPTPPPTNTPVDNPPPSSPGVTYCGCDSCTQAVWDTIATDGGGSYSCGGRITWLQTAEGGSKSEYNACKQVSEDFPVNQCGPACNPTLCNAPLLENPDPNNLIWSDEFNVDGAPDPNKWAYDIGDGCSIGLCNWGNGELAYYTNSPSNVDVANGILRITAKKEGGFSLPYTSTRMVTRGLHSFKYGRIQFRASLANCKAIGTWPALWMLPEDKVYGGWPNSGEIDVMEAVGHEAGRFFGTVHTGAYNGMIGTQKGGSIYKSKEEYHVFEIDWQPSFIQFAVDGKVYFEFQRGDTVDVWPFDQPFHLIMNIAVGGTWGGAQGIDESAFEGDGQTMEVDWVRVYANSNEPPQTSQTPSKRPTSPPIPPDQMMCGCASCTEAVLNLFAGQHTCGDRIKWVVDNNGLSEVDACILVAEEYPSICGSCHSEHC